MSQLFCAPCTTPDRMPVGFPAAIAGCPDHAWHAMISAPCPNTCSSVNAKGKQCMNPCARVKGHPGATHLCSGGQHQFPK